MKVPLLQAHRGYWRGGELENSLGALLEAQAQGFQMAEIDVQESGCGTPVVFHDANLLRIFRENCSLKKKTAKDLWTEYKIPCLAQVLEEVSLPLNLEIKANNWKRGHLELKVAEVILHCQALGRVIVSSFHPAALNFMRLYLPNLQLAWLIGADQPVWVKDLWLSSAVAFDWLDLDHRLLSEKKVSDLRKQGHRLMSWTVDDPERVQQLIDWGVESVISNSVRPQDLVRETSR